MTILCKMSYLHLFDFLCVGTVTTICVTCLSVEPTVVLPLIISAGLISYIIRIYTKKLTIKAETAIDSKEVKLERQVTIKAPEDYTFSNSTV